MPFSVNLQKTCVNLKHPNVNIVEANPQQENNFVFLSPFHSIFVIILPACLVSASQCRRVARKKPCAL